MFHTDTEGEEEDGDLEAECDIGEEAVGPAPGTSASVEQTRIDQGEDIVIIEAKSKKRITISLANQGSIVCTVCGQKGHTAGFRGAVYVSVLPFSKLYHLFLGYFDPENDFLDNENNYFSR